MDRHFSKDAHGRWMNAGRKLGGRKPVVRGRLRTVGNFGHATVTVTLKNLKKYFKILIFKVILEK
jgi:hypothetical protein